MLLAIVYCWLIALEGGLVNPLQPFLFIDRYACAGHQKPACGKLCLGITAIGRQLIPEDTLRQVFLHAADIEAAIDIAQLCSLHIPLEGQLQADLDTSATLVADTKIVHRLGVALVSLLTVGIGLITFLWHSC